MPIGILAGKAPFMDALDGGYVALRRRFCARGGRHLRRRHVRPPSAGARRRQGRAAPSQGRGARAAGASRQPHGRYGSSSTATSRVAAWQRAPKVIRAGPHQLRRRGAARRAVLAADRLLGVHVQEGFPASSRQRTATPISPRSRTPSPSRSMRSRPAASWRERVPGPRPLPRRLTTPRAAHRTAAGNPDGGADGRGRLLHLRRMQSSIALDGVLDPVRSRPR